MTIFPYGPRHPFKFFGIQNKLRDDDRVFLREIVASFRKRRALGIEDDIHGRPRKDIRGADQNRIAHFFRKPRRSFSLVTSTQSG